MAPKILFNYNFNYDLIFKSLFKEKIKNDWVVLSSRNERVYEYPTTEKTKSRLSELKIWWGNNGDSLLWRITELLDWERHNEKTTCMVIGYCHLFWGLALPLTLNINYPSDIDFVWSVILTHELIHVFQQQEHERQARFDESMSVFGLKKGLWPHALVFSLQDVIFRETGRIRYIDLLKRHYEGREEVAILKFIDENGSKVLLDEFKLQKPRSDKHSGTYLKENS